MWSNLSQFSNKRLSPIQSLFILSLLPLVAWLIAVDMAQYFLTEYWYVFNHLNSNYTTLGLIGLIIIFSVVARETLKVGYALVIMGIFFLVLIGHISYSKFYNELQRVPKIKSVSKNWTIQGDKIVITGRNFGGEYQPGQIIVGDLEFLISSWTNYKIVAEQPVPSKFITDTLILCNFLDNCISQGQFTITDPSTLQ